MTRDDLLPFWRFAMETAATEAERLGDHGMAAALRSLGMPPLPDDLEGALTIGKTDSHSPPKRPVRG